jgi:hypothetical protein
VEKTVRRANESMKNLISRSMPVHLRIMVEGSG